MIKRKSAVLATIGMLLFLVALFPFLFAAAHVYPLGFHEWDWLAGYAVELGTADYWDIQRYFYQNIGGRFFSTALLGSLPFWYSLTTFRLVVGLDLVLFFGGCFLFFREISPGHLGKILASVTGLLFLHQLTNCYDSLLRFTCMPVYHVGQLSLFLCIGLLYRWYSANQQGWGYLLLLGLVSFLASGTNEIIIVQLLLAFSTVFILGYQEGKRLPLRLILPFTCFLVGAFVALAAPGNFSRMEVYTASPSLLQTGGMTIAVSAFLWADWLFDSLLVPALLIVSYLYLRFFTHLRLPFFSRPAPWLVLLVLFCPLSLFPLLYASGGASLPERIVDLLYLNIIILSIGWVLSLLHVYTSKNSGKVWSGALMSTGTTLLVLYLVGQVFLGGLNINRKDRVASNWLTFIGIEANIGKAYLQLFMGLPQQYSQEMEQIEQQVKTCQAVVCRVPILSATVFLGYDPLYDRMHQQGESGMPVYLKSGASQVFYIKE